MEKRITCKVHGDNEIVIKVGVQQPNGIQVVFPIEAVWNDITNGVHTFYTFENNKKASVKAKVSPRGRKYLTTHPDGVTENNLDELTSCPA